MEAYSGKIVVIDDLRRSQCNAIEYDGCCIDIIDTKKSEITDLLLHNSSQFDNLFLLIGNYLGSVYFPNIVRDIKSRQDKVIIMITMRREQ